MSKKIGICIFLGLAVIFASCSKEDTYKILSSKVDNSQVISDLKKVNSELLSIAQPCTRGWGDKDKIKVVTADVTGAWGGGKIGAEAGGVIGMAFGSPITGGIFGAFLGGVIGGAYASWMTAPVSMVPVIDNSQSIEEACKILINDDMSINRIAIKFAELSTLSRATTTTSKLHVDEELIIESKLDENSLNIGEAHNIILSVMDGSVILQTEDNALPDSFSLKEALFKSEAFVDECKMIGADASVGRFLTSDTMLSKVMELFNQVLEGYASKTDDVAFIIGKYVEVIERSNELSTEQAQSIKFGLATALYSFKYWEITFNE